VKLVWGSTAHYKATSSAFHANGPPQHRLTGPAHHHQGGVQGNAGPVWLPQMFSAKLGPGTYAL
jgi:hypothetical protein